MKTGSILTILAAVAAVVVAAVVASGGGGGSGGEVRSSATLRARRPPPRPAAQQLSFVVSPEKEAAAQGGGGEVQRLRRAGRRQARLRLDEGDELRRRRERDRPRAPAARRVVAGRLLLGAAAEPARRPALRGPATTRRSCAPRWSSRCGSRWRRRSAIRASRVAFKDIVAPGHRPAADGPAVGKPNFGRFKYVHTNPDSSTSGAEAVDRLLLRAGGQEGGADRRRRRPGRPARQGPRALDRALRRLDALHRGPALQGRAGLRLGGGDGGDDGHRLQPPPLLEHQARRALPRRRARSSATRPTSCSTPTG